jgi:peptidoglycan hydrolase-like protein with peptidoglycan-binding domain
VVLLYGSTPAYRTLTAGTTGTDVAELNANLIALNYATAAELGSADFGAATAAALKKLQAALGEPPDGVLTLGQAVFQPAALRVTSVSVQLGGAGQVGQPVLQATSTTRLVQVALSAAQQSEVATGDTVRITLPNNQSTSGVVSSVGTVATCASNSGASRSSPTAPGTDACASGNAAAPTITVNVTPAYPAATGTWDQAPVRIGITTASVSDVLAVPVTALLARSDGSYAVQVIGPGNTSRLAAVSLGLFDDADGLGQVTGAELAAGQQIVVPAT